GLLPRRWRGELSLSAGGSSYANFASFWHATAEARLHFVAAGRGAWIGGTGGRTSYGRAARPVVVAGVGVWARRSWVTVALSATRSIVGDTAYSDVGSTLPAIRSRSVGPLPRATARRASPRDSNCNRLSMALSGSSYTLSPERPWKWPAISRIGSRSPYAARARIRGNPGSAFRAAYAGSTCELTVGGGPRRQGRRALRPNSAAKWGPSRCPNLARPRATPPPAGAAARASPTRRTRVRAPGGSCSSATPSVPPPTATDRS